MAENTHIEWATHTFNPWWGCTKVSDGCKHCYADTLSHRFGFSIWGPDASRRAMTEGYWKQLRRWNKQASDAVERPRVFVASMSDIFEGPETCQNRDAYLVIEEAREHLFDEIILCPNLDFLLLSKRPENMKRFAPSQWELAWPPNAWAGTSVEDQKTADRRTPELLKVPAAIRFLSCEPLLGPVDLSRWIGEMDCASCRVRFWGDTCPICGIKDGEDEMGMVGFAENAVTPYENIHWIIAGGESGTDARPMHPDWAQSLRVQCAEAGVPFFFKQWGEWIQGRDLEDYRLGQFHGETVEVEQRSNPDQCTRITLCKAGKRVTGRILDGRTHDEYPEVQHA